MPAHWWSGWPGAYCLKCGADDPAEDALGDERVKLDYPTGGLIYPSPEVEAEYKAREFCPVEDDPAIHPWLNFKSPDPE